MNNQELLGIGELLKRTFQIYKSRILVLLLIMAVPLLFSLVFIPLFIFSFLLYLVFIPFYKTLIFLLLPLSVLVLLTIVFGITMFILNLWASISLLYVIKERDKKIGIGEAFNKGWSKILSYWWLSIISGFIVAGGYLLFIVPGIILNVWFSLAAYVLVSEEKKGMTALLRSKQLMKGYWWKVFWRFLMLGVIVLVIALVTGFIPLIRNFIYLLTTPFCIIFGCLIYEDLKKIKKGVLFEPLKRKTKIGFILIGAIGILLIPAIIVTSIILILLLK